MMKQKLITSLALALLFFTGVQAMTLPIFRDRFINTYAANPNSGTRAALIDAYDQIQNATTRALADQMLTRFGGINKLRADQQAAAATRQPPQAIPRGPQPPAAAPQPPQAVPRGPQPPAVTPRPAGGREAMLEQARKLGMERAAARAKGAPGGPIVPAIPGAPVVPSGVQQTQQAELSRRRAQAAQREIKHLQSNVGTLQQQISTNRDTITKLRADLTTARTTAPADMKKLINDLLDQNQRDGQRADQARQDIIELQRRIAHIRQQFEGADLGYVNELEGLIETLRNNLHNTQAVNQILEQAAARHREQLEAAQRQPPVVLVPQEVQRIIEEAQEQLREAQDRVTNLNQQLQQQRNSNAKLQSDLAKASKNVPNNNRIVELENQLHNANQDLDRATDTIRGLQGQITTLNQKLLAAPSSAQLQLFQTEIRELRNQVQVAQEIVRNETNAKLYLQEQLRLAQEATAQPETPPVRPQGPPPAIVNEITDRNEIAVSLLDIANLPEKRFNNELDQIQKYIARINLAGIVKPVLDAILEAFINKDEALDHVIRLYNNMTDNAARGALLPLYDAARKARASQQPPPPPPAPIKPAAQQRVPAKPTTPVDIADMIVGIARMSEANFNQDFAQIQRNIAELNLAGIAQPVLKAIIKALGSLDQARNGIVNTLYDLLDEPARAALRPLLIELTKEPGQDPIIVANLEAKIAQP
jgi:hypothetical protein